MQSDTLVSGLALVALFFAVVSSYAYMLRVQRDTSLVAGSPFRTGGIDFLFKTSFLSKQQFPSPIGGRTGNTAPRSTGKSRLSAASDWLVPIIVWVLVLLMSAAIVGFLLNGR